MKKKIIISLFAALTAAASLFLFYKPSNIFANKQTTPKSGLCVKAKALTKQQECIDVFGESGKYLVKSKTNKIYPIEINLQNKEFKTSEISSVEANIPLASQSLIQKRLKKGRWGRIFKKNKKKILLTGLSIVAISTGIGLAFGIYAIATATCGCPCFLIPAVAAPIITTGAGLVLAPTTMAVYVATRGEKQAGKNKIPLTLEPGQTQTLYLFVEKKDYQENLELTFADGNGNKETISCYCPLN